MNLCLATSFKLFILVIFINLSVLAIIDFAYAVEPEEFLKDPTIHVVRVYAYLMHYVCVCVMCFI